MSIDKIISRVQKLLSMSKSDNEHEAAQAAARASALMAEYNLSEAMLRVEDSSRGAEAIVEGRLSDQQTKKRSAWRELIADAVASSLGCVTYLSKTSETVCFGREGATQAWNYTSQYLFNEVDRLADEAWDREGMAAMRVGQRIRSWKNAFRVGAAAVVASRLRDATAAQRDERVAKRQGVQSVVHPKPATTEQQALMVMERDEQEVKNAYAERTKGFVKSAGVGRVTSRTGYNAGREAGASVALGGGRAALGAGQGRLK